MVMFQGKNCELYLSSLHEVNSILNATPQIIQRLPLLKSSGVRLQSYFSKYMYDRKYNSTTRIQSRLIGEYGLPLVSQPD